MLKRYLDKNKFGHHTWEMFFDPVFPIRIYETNDNSYLVELLEYSWFKTKVHFTFISTKTLQETIVETLDKVFDYFIQNKEYNWTIYQKEIFENEVLEELDIYVKNKRVR